MNGTDFWRQVKSLLLAKGITHENAVRSCGFNINTFHNWIKRGIVPSVEDAIRLARFLDVSVEFLATGKKNDAHAEIREILGLLETIDKRLERLSYRYE